MVDKMLENLQHNKKILKFLLSGDKYKLVYRPPTCVDKDLPEVVKVDKKHFEVDKLCGEYYVYHKKHEDVFEDLKTNKNIKYKCKKINGEVGLIDFLKTYKKEYKYKKVLK